MAQEVEANVACPPGTRLALGSIIRFPVNPETEQSSVQIFTSARRRVLLTLNPDS
jgi:hypothetical protein